MKKVIVTGANGFVGTALLNELSKRNIKIIAIVRNEYENISDISDLPDVRLVYCELDNISQLPNLVEDRDIDACVHLAWTGSTGELRSDYELQLMNIKYSLDVVNILHEMGINRFVGAGTLAEKDVLQYHPLDGATPNAVSVYGIAKVSAHYMTKVKCTSLGIEHIWCYLSNTYGIGNKTNNFINFACKLMINGKRASFTEGEQIYDFIYITDTARAIYFAASKGEKNTAYYLGSNKPRKLKEYIKIIRDTIDPNITLHLGEIPFNGTSLPPQAFDCSKLVNDTGYYPLVNFKDGIKKTVEWLRNEGENNGSKV